MTVTQMRARRLQPDEACQLIATIAESLHYAHQRGLVHRDVKPATFSLGRTTNRTLWILVSPAATTSSAPARSGSSSPPGTKCYQLAHDYLVASLRSWLTRKRQETRRGRAELLSALNKELNGKPAVDRRWIVDGFAYNLSRTPQCPMNGSDWLESARYCCWISAPGQF